MTGHRDGLLVVVIGAQRKRANTHALAAKFGVERKILVPLDDKPLIAHVLQTLSTYEGIARIAVSVEDCVMESVRTAMGAYDFSKKIDFVLAADNITDSVIQAADGHEGPLIITTADHALLTHQSIDAMVSALHCADVAVAMAPREAVLAAHPDGQRRFYRFKDGEYSNCNLYGMAHKDALQAAEAFRSGGQFVKKASRIVEAFGFFTLVLFRLRLITLAGIFRRLSNRFRLRLIPVVLTDGSQAIDVDNDRTHGVVSELLALRAHQDRVDTPFRSVS